MSLQTITTGTNAKHARRPQGMGCRNKFQTYACFALVLWCTYAPSVTQAMSFALAEVAVTPQSQFKTLAQTLKNLPSGQRVIYLQGFADDIAKYDWFVVRTAPTQGSRKVVSQRFQSPWLDKGIMVVNARVSNFMSKLSKAGAPIERFRTDVPTSVSGTRLADSSLPALSSILADPRSLALSQLIDVPNLAALSTDTDALNKWRAASPGRVAAMLSLAIDSAVTKWYPMATGPNRSTLPPIAPQTAITVVSNVGGATPVVPPVPPVVPPVPPVVPPVPPVVPPVPPVVPPVPPVVPPVPPVVPPVPVVPTVVDNPNALQNAAISANVEAVFNQTTTPRLTSNWQGTLKYTVGTEWTALITAAQTSPALRQLIFSVDLTASNADNSYMYVRPYSLADIHPSILNPRVANLGANSERYGLAIADCSQAFFVQRQGVNLAIAGVYANNPTYIAKSIEILNAMIDHSPIQRPGWTLMYPESTLPEGGDGVWLATNSGICGIVDMLSILGDRVPTATRDSLHNLLRAEVGRITADWAARRQWFVQSQSVACNQWIEPNIGLVKACLYLQDPALLDAYNMGVENLARSIKALGEDGAFLEGFSYCSQTSGGLFDVLANLKANGDMRCHAFPYVNNAWKWMLQMYLPGRRFVNSHDSGMSNLPSWAISVPMDCLAAAAVGSSDPDAIPTLKSFFNGGLPLIAGIRYKLASDAASPLTTFPTFAFFPSQQQLVWRSAWQAPAITPQTALAVWLKGGSVRDGHSQRDQGQVSIYCGDRIVLMDCGTPDYSTSGFEVNYAQAAGHGIMQIGQVIPRSQPVDAPVVVSELNQQGGDVMIDTTAAYTAAHSCTRRVQWTSDGIFTIDDHVALISSVTTGTEFYRFHTGTADALAISGSGTSWEITWPGTAVTITASRPVIIEQVDWPDATKAPFHHRALIVRAVDAGTSLDLTTRIAVDKSVTE